MSRSLTEAIRVSDLGKTYRIWDDPASRLKSPLWSAVAGRFPADSRIRERLEAVARSHYRDFHALRDINFAVGKGEAVAILGRNGAGKSTLLQLLVGTLQPSGGEVSVSGKVAALLELGSGFNPEFTGRENVYLNCALLGLDNRQTADIYDSIVDFADIGDFIEQPVKTYSTGMMLRLAFAVQTSVHPEVLIIDEALAVGDVFFQAKCMQRLRGLVEAGVTLLFVSHDIGTVKQLCTRAILLEEGTLTMDGKAREVCDYYHRQQVMERNLAQDKATQTIKPDSAQAEQRLSEPSQITNEEYLEGQAQFRKHSRYNRSGNGKAEILNIQLRHGEYLSDNFDFGDEIRLCVAIRFHEDLSDVNLAYTIKTPQGVDLVFGDVRLNRQLHRSYHRNGIYLFEWKLDMTLMHGRYLIGLNLSQPPGVAGDDWSFLDVVPVAAAFTMNPRGEGMISGYLSWQDNLTVSEISHA